jgi:hypothetical protein
VRFCSKLASSQELLVQKTANKYVSLHSVQRTASFNILKLIDPLRLRVFVTVLELDRNSGFWVPTAV